MIKNSNKLLAKFKEHEDIKLMVHDVDYWISIFETSDKSVILKDFSASSYHAGGQPRYTLLNYSLRDIESGDKFKVYKKFTDFYGNEIPIGTELKTLNINFLPYDGGFTWKCENVTVYLQETEQKDIVENLYKYVYCIN